MYRSQVDRLKRDIAALERKAAEERSKANHERAEALRLRSSISRTSSETTARSKHKQAQQRDEQAVGHEKKAASLAEDMGRKGEQLNTAQASLERALAQQQKKDEVEQRRRRNEELRHIQRLEAARLAAQSQAAALPALAPAGQHVRRAPGQYEFDVCLSFAGEERGYVEMVAQGLKEHGLRVFYDLDESATLWGKNLVEHFDHIYRYASRYCVMFISAAYAAKPWARHERRSALARALVEEGEYILPARFDDTDLPGLQPTIHYLDLRNIAPATLVEFVLQKLGQTPVAGQGADG